jgi:hypothetical protein
MKVTTKNLMHLLCLLALLTSCVAKVEEDKPYVKKEAVIDTQNPLNGKINGENWRYTHAVAKKSHFDEKEYQFSFYDEEITDPCNNFARSSAAFYTGSLEVGRVNFSNTETMTLYYTDGTSMNHNIGITEGFIEISSFEDDLVDITIKAAFDKDNYLGGTVEVEVCE